VRHTNTFTVLLTSCVTVWISLFCKKMSVVIQLIPNQSNRRSIVQ